MKNKLLGMSVRFDKCCIGLQCAAVLTSFESIYCLTPQYEDILDIISETLEMAENEAVKQEGAPLLLLYHHPTNKH